jgi:hypothetical protein
MPEQFDARLVEGSRQAPAILSRDLQMVESALQLAVAMTRQNGICEERS